MWIVAFTILYMACLAVLLVVAKRHKGKYALAKGVCSFLFVAAAVLSWSFGPRRLPGMFAVLLAALLLCAFGDVLLGVSNMAVSHPDKRFFVAGGLSFAVAHVLFVVLFSALWAMHWYDWIFPLLLLAVMLALDLKGKVRLKKLRYLAYVYTVLVGLMAWKAAGGLLYAAAPGTGAVEVCVGAMLFLISDILLLFLYFGVRRFKWLRSANLISYYMGVYLLALSAFWI